MVARIRTAWEAARGHVSVLEKAAVLAAYLSTLVLSASLMSSAAQAEPKSYVIDPSHTTVGFLVTHVGYAKTFGMFRALRGSFNFDEESRTLSDIKVVVETKSVFTNDKRRDAHLRSKDFLDVKNHPEMIFTANRATITGERTGKVMGELTLLGQTHPLTLDVVWNKSGDYPFGHGLYTMGVSARGTVKRSTFGMTYALADNLVGDDVELIIEFEANQK